MKMSDIVLIKGKVKHRITLDPSVWIFDDRKRRLEDFFIQQQDQADPDQDYKEQIGKQWDKELKEGYVETKQSENWFAQKKDISGDWGILLGPFLNNAEPLSDVSSVLCHLQSGETVKISLSEAKNSILCFAINGRPIRNDGPIHLFFADGSNKSNPLKGIQAFELI